MSRGIGLFSTQTISPKGLAHVMGVLKATAFEDHYIIERSGQSIWIELATQEIEDIPIEIIREVMGEFDDLGSPTSLVTVVFDQNAEDDLGRHLAKAVGIALAEEYEIVWHDYANYPERLYAPGQRPDDNN